MHPIQVITSRTAVLPNKDIDTDQIIPARFLTTTQREGLGAHVFAEWRFDKNGELRSDFVLNTPAAAGCKVLVAGDNFGCGSSREHAPWALLDYGIEVVISTSMADIFRSNALKNGLLPIVVDQDTHTFLLSHPGIEVTVDLATKRLQYDSHPIDFEIDDFSQYCLLNGVDELGYLLDQQPHIETWERGH